MGFKSIIGILGTYLIVVSFNTSAAQVVSSGYTDSTGKEWGQIGIVSGVSWLDIMSACGSSTNYQCDSTYTDIDGWTWASSNDVLTLFSDFTGPVTLTGSTYFGSTSNESWATNFFTYFNPNITLSWADRAHAETRDFSGTQAISATLFDILDDSNIDQFTIWPNISTSLVANNLNIWLYKESVSAVPIPAAVWLFGSGLLAFVGVARRKKL